MYIVLVEVTGVLQLCLKQVISSTVYIPLQQYVYVYICGFAVGALQD